MDLLVKLYELPPLKLPPRDAAAEVIVRRAFAAEKTLVSNWIAEHFSRAWADECEMSFARVPVACFVATKAETLVGFACYDATARGFFGPTAVAESARRRGIGCTLLLHTLHDMAACGYGYAIIGAADNIQFYRHCVAVVEIDGSAPGFYRGLLHHS